MCLRGTMRASAAVRRDAHISPTCTTARGVRPAPRAAQPTAHRPLALALLTTRSYPPMHISPAAVLHTSAHATTRIEYTSCSDLPNRYGGMTREGPAPAMCSKRDGTAKQRRESVGGGEADGQRRARWAACTHGVRASAVILHGIPAGEHAPGGRSRSVSGAEGEQ